jgi:glycosyltransferase involved in cell wall biosynthesis
VLRQALRRSRAEWLYVPYGDGLSQVLGARRTMMLPTIPRGIPAEALMMRGSFAYPAQDLKQKLSAKASWAMASRAPWSVVHVLDPVVYDAIVHRRRGSRVTDRYRLMPDPVEVPVADDRTAARARLGLPTGGRYVVCVGIIDRRKGCDMLIEAFARAVSGPSRLTSEDRLLLAGRHEPAVRELLASQHSQLVREGRILSMDRTLVTEQLLDALVASDLVAALYPRHIGSSSIVIRAAAARRLVLAHHFGWLGAIVPKFGLGWTCDATNLDELTEAIPTALDRTSNHRPTEAADRFVAFHSIENFRAHWTAELRRYLNLAPAAHQRLWEWALEATRGTATPAASAPSL